MLSQTVKVLVVPVEESVPVRVAVVEAEHEVFCGLVGDVNTDTVFFADYSGLVRVAANGKASGAAVNPRATQMVERFAPGFTRGDWVAGPGVFVGLDEDGAVGDVADEVLGFAQAHWEVEAAG